VTQFSAPGALTIQLFRKPALALGVATLFAIGANTLIPFSSPAQAQTSHSTAHPGKPTTADFTSTPTPTTLRSMAKVPLTATTFELHAPRPVSHGRTSR
jgi:hypothetical protein